MEDSRAHQIAGSLMPLVSIIIPTYNRAALLKYALDSVIAQTLQDFEVIVLDDGSTDKTEQLVEGYSPKMHYVHLQHCGLPSAVRNVGLRSAQGDYIAFLDSDDQWLPQKLERQVEILEKYPSVGLVCSNALVLEDGQDRPGRLYLRDEQGGGGQVLNELLKDNFVITSTAVIRRSLLSRAGIFSEDPLLRAIEDYDLWLRIAAVSEVYYIPEALALYREQPGSIRTQQSRVSYWQGMLLILKRLGRHLRDWGYQDTRIERLMDDLAYTYRCYLLNAHWIAGQYVDAVKCFWQLFCEQPMDALKLGYKVVRRRLRFRTLINRRSSAFKDLWQREQIQQSQGRKEDGQASKGVNQGIKLHLGCGEIYLPGYINIDFPSTHHTVQKRSKADSYADIRQLSYPPESVEEIRLHHVFEHFDRATALCLLIEWYEWLKEGGQLVIETPDFERCVHAFDRRSRRIEDQMKALRHIFGSQEAGWAHHYDGWYRAKFELYLASLGYRALSFRHSEWHGTYNITVTAKKIRPFKAREEFRQAAEKLLHFSLIDDSESEKRVLKIWTDQLGQSSVSRDANENPAHS